MPNSGVALAVNQITSDKNKAFLVSGAASSDLTGKACSPNTIHWTYDTWMLANGTGSAIVKTGGDSWFFLTADYAFGHALERDTEAVVLKNGGKVLGKVRQPLNTQDFSSFLLQAQASKAKIIGLANAGGDTTNSIKQAAEFGIVKGGQNLAGLLVFLTDVHSLGLPTAQGLIVTETFYWDQNDAVARVREALRGGEQGHSSDDDPRRRLLGGAPLPEGGRGAEERRRHEGHRADEAKPTDDPLFGKGIDPRRRPQDPPGVSGRSEEAGGVEGAVGLLQDPRDDSRGPGVPAAGGRRVSAREVTQRADPQARSRGSAIGVRLGRPRAGGDPVTLERRMQRHWVPAFAGMTILSDRHFRGNDAGVVGRSEPARND